VEVDYIIAGSGIAGCTLAAELHLRGCKLAMFSIQDKNSSSRIAAGLINPIVPKRVIPAWNAEFIFPAIENYYRQLELLTKDTFYDSMPMIQIHGSENEFHQWKIQSEKKDMQPFLRSFPPGRIHGIEASFGYCEVNFCGRLDVLKFCESMENLMMQRHHFHHSLVDYNQIIFESNFVKYGNLKAKGMVFCEGTSIENNPFFSNIPVNKSWGDILEISVSQHPDPGIIFKQKHWCISKTNGNFLCGSNFLLEEGNKEDVELKSEEILNSVTKWFPVKSLISSVRGARPVMPDRRPVMGRHPHFPALMVYNGLGTRGCSLSTWLSPLLADHITLNSELPEEVRVERFPFHSK